ncbi:PEP motif putative anchor domain protein [[Leptolyngbya] sp. PCC 7376]|uniref:PTPA-CTERM sorting domain-containing protein n=1 Tax=[Leptolyngbya] sp. PCC 7376 TaxID=111781 RepID=UPI00029EFBC2|nr:PTPA-CTERM sorting domain-containing protein [[Leptolyngbya] sp. PCC 7376]AFY36922.1 PEP motif putative anchor domain protein [[Leptolyngbya] sp. PCC 7376]
MFQHKLSLGVAAATVMGVSMVSVTPAQALTLEGDDKIDILGTLEVTNGGGGNYDFDFWEFGTSGQEGLSATGTAGKFQLGDFVGISDISLPDADAFGTAPLDDFITDILLADGSIADFDVSSVAFSAREVGADTIFDLVFDGFIETSTGQTAAALGSFSSQIGTSFIVEDGSNNTATFSGTLRVKREDEITEVPTPAAILPTLFGLGGLAAKRKKRDDA